MIVAVETNFILELALQQQDAEHAEIILQMAEAKDIQLAIPAFSFTEAHLRLASQSKKRNFLYQELRNEIRQMARSGPFAELEKASESITDALVSSATIHANQFWKTTDRLRASATVIPLTAAVTGEVSFLDLIFELQPADACVFASVHGYIKENGGSRSLFVTKDRDFLQTAEYLASVNSELVVGFAPALTAIKKAITPH